MGDEFGAHGLFFAALNERGIESQITVGLREKQKA